MRLPRWSSPSMLCPRYGLNHLLYFYSFSQGPFQSLVVIIFFNPPSPFLRFTYILFCPSQYLPFCLSDPSLAYPSFPLSCSDSLESLLQGHLSKLITDLLLLVKWYVLVFSKTETMLWTHGISEQQVWYIYILICCYYLRSDTATVSQIQWYSFWPLLSLPVELMRLVVFRVQRHS